MKIFDVILIPRFSSLSVRLFSYTVMCKVCLTASTTVFLADAVVRQNHWILPKVCQWGFWFSWLTKHAEHILLSSLYLLQIYLASLSARSWARKSRSTWRLTGTSSQLFSESDLETAKLSCRVFFIPNKVKFVFLPFLTWRRCALCRFGSW